MGGSARVAAEWGTTYAPLPGAACIASIATPDGGGAHLHPHALKDRQARELELAALRALHVAQLLH